MLYLSTREKTNSDHTQVVNVIAARKEIIITKSRNAAMTKMTRRNKSQKIIQHLKTYPLFQQDKIPPMAFGIEDQIVAAISKHDGLAHTRSLIKTAIWTILEVDGYRMRWEENKSAKTRYDLMLNPSENTYTNPEDAQKITPKATRRPTLTLNKRQNVEVRRGDTEGSSSSPTAIEPRRGVIAEVVA